MKKTLAILMAALMLATFTACGGADTETKKDETTTDTTAETKIPEDVDGDEDDAESEEEADSAEDDTVAADDSEATEDTESSEADIPAAEAGSALEIFETVWAAHGDDEKFFAMGGGYTNMVDGAPGTVEMSDTDAFTALFYTPADYISDIDDAASVIHSMNTNTFTGIVYHFADTSVVDSFISDAEDALKNAQWMCGQPEKMIIATIDGGYVTVFFGASDIVDNFNAKLSESITGVTVVTEGPVVG